MQTKTANLKIDDLTMFETSKILDNSTTDFDIYIKIKDHVILYGGDGYKWLRAELERLLANGYENLFCIKSQIEKFEMYKKLYSLPEVEKNLAPKDRIKSIQEIGSSLVKCVYEGSITSASVYKASSVANTMINCIAEDRSCIKELSGLGDYDYYTYAHCMRTSAYIVDIAMQMGLKDEQILTELALGGIFHDIGKKLVPLDIINKQGALTPNEWEQVKLHPVNGYHVISYTSFPGLALEIVLKHHEKLDGSGYPNGLMKESLITEVQISTLADIFDAMSSTRSYQNKRSKYEALDFIKHNLLNTKIASEPYQALISCLAD